MITLRVTLTAALVLLIYSSDLAAQLMARQSELTVSGSYFQCTNPHTNPACVCLRSDDKERKCPGCQSWEEVPFSTEVDLDLQYARYENANVFLTDVAYSVYEAPQTASGSSATTTQLFENPERFGWVQLGSEDPVVGSVSVWRGMVGLVVSDSNGVVKVLYPSGSLGGQLRVRDLRPVFGERPKYLLPIDFVNAVAREESARPEGTR